MTATEIKRRGTWPVFFLACCALLILMLIPGITAVDRTGEVYGEIRQIQETYERNQRLLDALARNLGTVSIVLREFLLDPNPENSHQYVQQILTSREELQREFGEMRGMLNGREADAFQKLDRELGAYWGSVLPVFRWSPREKRERATYFLRQEQRPRRESILAITNEIARLNTVFYRDQYERINASEVALRRDLNRVVRFVFLAGIAVSLVAIFRIRKLEARTRIQHERVERTGEELRSLSKQLRHLQEEERKTISRELHDEVGQKLTALRMEAGSLERLREDPGKYRECVAEIKALAEQSLRTIRDIAAGLRPSMLDDLGLAPALQRQVREFSRHAGKRVGLEIDGSIDGIPERHQIYIYRIVQELLTNCAKHSRADNIAIRVAGGDTAISLAISDDGIGFDPAAADHGGLGLVGVHERVRELHGSLSIRSQAGQGTTLHIEIPREHRA